MNEKRLVNLCKKYDITLEEFDKEINSLDLGKICNVQVLIAVCDLLSTGDIPMK